MKLGVLPLARGTFDVPFAEERVAAAFAALERAGHAPAGPRTLLLDGDAALAALDALDEERPDALLILQATFTDAAATLRLAERFTGPLAIWALPEPRAGGRLRLNAFCGLNLAAHALTRAGRAFAWAYADPAEADATLRALFEPRPPVPPAPRDAAPADEGARAAGLAAAAAIRGARIGRIGERPAGFVTCDYDAEELRRLAGVTVEPLPLDALFSVARSLPEPALDKVRQQVEGEVESLAGLDEAQLARSLRLAPALRILAGCGRYDALAVRCWPETFTEYGGAVCGPAAMLGEDRTPCACEADVYGALTSLLLQEVAGSPAFLVDVVDIDAKDDTGVVWHCGQAPISMADPKEKPRATVHSNRRQPFLYEFALRPGRVTLARISQAQAGGALVIAGADVLERPPAFTGTSGTLRFDRPAGEVAAAILGIGLEHHVSLAYGDHREALHGAAEALRLPVLEIA